MTIAEISKYKKNILGILFDILVSVNNAKYIGAKSTENEDWVKSHPFFKYYFHQLRFILIIQLTKLFNDSRNEKYNFYKFLRTLESTPLPETNESNRNRISNSSQMAKLIADLKLMLEEFKVDITILINLRNNVYAHSKQISAHSESGIITLSNERIEALTELAFNIYNKITGEFYDGEFIFPNKKNWSPEWLIQRVAETRHKIP